MIYPTYIRPKMIVLFHDTNWEVPLNPMQNALMMLPPNDSPLLYRCQDYETL